MHGGNWKIQIRISKKCTPTAWVICANSLQTLVSWISSNILYHMLQIFNKNEIILFCNLCFPPSNLYLSISVDLSTLVGN